MKRKGSFRNRGAERRALLLAFLLVWTLCLNLPAAASAAQSARDLPQLPESESVPVSSAAELLESESAPVSSAPELPGSESVSAFSLQSLSQLLQSPDVQTQLLCFARVWLFSAVGLGYGFQIFLAMLEKKRNTGWLIVWMYGKSFALLFDEVVGRYFFGSAVWWQVGHSTVNFLMSVATNLLLCLFFCGGLGQLCIVICLGDILTELFLLPAILLLNLLERRPDLFAYAVPLTGPDLLFPLLMGILFIPVFFRARPVLQRFRHCRIRCQSLLFLAYITYLVLAQSFPLLDLGTKDVIAGVYLFFLCVLGLVMSAVVCLVWLRRRSGRREREFLEMQIRVQRMHYEAVVQERRRMERNRTLIDRQMEEIRKMTEETGRTGQKSSNEAGKQEVSADQAAFRSQRLRSYLRELQESFEGLHAGIYCSDPTTDAVLYCQAETAGKAGIAVHYRMQGFDRGAIEDSDLAGLLYSLLDRAIRANLPEQTEGRPGRPEPESPHSIRTGAAHFAGNSPAARREISLSAFTVKNTLILQLSATCFKSVRLRKSQFAFWVRKYGGAVSLNAGKHDWNVDLMLPNTQNGEE